MEFDPQHQSNDLEDRRGAGGAGGGGGSGIIGFLVMMLLRTRYGWIGAIVLLVGYFGARQLGLMGSASDTPTTTHTTSALAPSDTQAHFVAFVLDDVQTYWDGVLRSKGQPYRHAKLTLFTDQTSTGCGYSQAATGPFYCPNDEHVYIDLGFFQVMSDKLGATGQFARAYVIAHEIGHHVQKVLGISARAERGHIVGASGNSVRIELQADCYAGVWAASAGRRNLLERGDIESALTAAARIGDDVLQKEETGRVRPETFTHGTADQRYRWLKRGYDTSDMTDCDTFAAATP